MAISFKTFVSRFNKLEKKIVPMAQDIIMKYQSEVINLSNKQLLEGEDINNKIMQRGYSPAYGKRRKKSGLQTSFVDLKFTGQYQDTKRLFKTNKGFDIRSAADYEAHLRANFPDHVGLNKVNADEIAELLATDLAVEIDKYFS